MTERILSGASASPGVGLGSAWRRADRMRSGALVPCEKRERERDAALAALAAAAEELSRLAAGLPAEEAAIIDAGVLMAGDPALASAVEEAIMSHGLPAADAVLQSTERHATAIAQIDDPTLAARADDVRSLGRRAARLAGRETDYSPPDTPVILIADDLGPADVAELAPVLGGVALAGGGATAHAAIVARSLGVPMVTGLGAAAAQVAAGALVALDGTAGSLVIDPASDRRRAVAAEIAASASAAARSTGERDLPAVSLDGRRITVLANVATVAELEIALGSGAEGIGLLRTELAFLEATDWPAESDHAHALAPILAALADRAATVRVLDFGADKTPPFLHGQSQRGLELLLANVDAFTRQLRAILVVGQGRQVRILLPMVDRLGQLTAARELVDHTARALGMNRLPPVGAMIETPAAAECAPALADGADFLSIGTNDLTATVLGADRFAAGSAHAHDPRVLRAIAASVDAAHAAGRPLEVCGEAASDPLMLALLVGLGVDELSVGAARVGTVRNWIRQLSYADAEPLARSALQMETAEQVALAAAPLARELQSVQTGDAASERIERDGGVFALGA